MSPTRKGARLSGAQERKLRVKRGLPRYTPNEAAGRRRLARAAYTDKRRAIDRIKLDSGCVVCGYDAHPAALEFDHLPGHAKRDDVSRLLRAGSSIEVILAEIAKCEVVCANCHRIRTAERELGGQEALL